MITDICFNISKLIFMKKIIVANWKMYGNPASAGAWTQAFLAAFPAIPAGVTVVACPPAPLLPLLKKSLAGSQIHLGGQDCHTQQEGAYTGETSADLLKDVGCAYVIVGHSERRAFCFETDDIVRKKAARAIKAGLVPIICIGETKEQRDSGKTMAVINRQIEKSTPDEAMAGNFILAYEPVWAIGSGSLPAMDEIRQVHIDIMAGVSKRTGVDIAQIMVLYGGSVKPSNAAEILALPEVSGVLVGGASLKADEFGGIVAGAVGG